jgi:hypothetical protein
MTRFRPGEVSKTETSEIFQKALQASLKRTGESLKTAATNPVETLKGVPAGVGLFFDRVSRDVKTGIQRVDDTKDQQGGQSGESTSEAVMEGASTAGEGVIGCDDSRRRLAKHLGVDPVHDELRVGPEDGRGRVGRVGRRVRPGHGDRLRPGRLRRQVHARLGERPCLGHDAG